MKRPTLIIIFVVVVSILLSFMFSDKIHNSYMESLLARELNRYPKGKQFLKTNPHFIKSLADKPQMLSIIRNAIISTPRMIDFLLRHRDQFVDDLKNNPLLMQRYTFLCIYPSLVLFTIDNYEAVNKFLLKYPDLADSLAKDHEFARYICVEHPSMVKSIMISNDPVTTAKKISEQYVINRFIKPARK